MTFQVAEIENTLAAVSRIVAGGNKVVFDSPELGSFMENKATGNRTYFRQSNGVYYMDVWVKPGKGYDNHENEQGFQRQGP